MKPPNSPINKKVRIPGFIRSDSFNPARIPMSNEPDKLTTRVPHGNTGYLKYWAVEFINAKRIKVPRAPPAARVM